MTKFTSKNETIVDFESPQNRVLHFKQCDQIWRNLFLNSLWAIFVDSFYSIWQTFVPTLTDKVSLIPIYDPTVELTKNYTSVQL